MSDSDSIDADWMVLVNDEAQYSIWPSLNDIPAGWQAIGPSGSESTCKSYVEEVWKDMRPLSLRA